MQRVCKFNIVNISMEIYDIPSFTSTLTDWTCDVDVDDDEHGVHIRWCTTPHSSICYSNNKLFCTVPNNEHLECIDQMEMETKTAAALSSDTKCTLYKKHVDEEKMLRQWVKNNEHHPFDMILKTANNFEHSAGKKPLFRFESVHFTCALCDSLVKLVYTSMVLIRHHHLSVSIDRYHRHYRVRTLCAMLRSIQIFVCHVSVAPF